MTFWTKSIEIIVVAQIFFYQGTTCIVPLYCAYLGKLVNLIIEDIGPNITVTDASVTSSC